MRVLVVCVVLAGSVVRASPKDDALEQQFRADIAAIDADAARAWDRGNAARTTGLSEAEAAYREAITLAPNVDHPHRRLCSVYTHMKRHDDAIRECERALAIAPASAYDQGAMADSLVMRGHVDDRARALSLAVAAAHTLPDDTTVVRIECIALVLDARNVNEAAACVDHLRALAPDDMAGRLLAIEVALLRGDLQAARILLEQARDAGLSAGDYARFLALLDDAKKPRRAVTLHDVYRVGIPVLGGWLLSFVLLLLVGRRLSRATLRDADRLTADDLEGTPRERRLRTLYRLVLQLTAVFFYASLPLLVVVVIAAALVTLFVFDKIGATPIIVLFGLIVMVVTTITSVVRALFFTPKPKFEGKTLDPRGYPALREVLEATAKAIGTRSVDVVQLTVGTDAGVFEQQTLFQAMFGSRTQRVLVLGVALFDNMKQREFRSILAHEYGHFRNADTGGGLALAVRRSLLTLLGGISRSGYALFNPAWWALRAFTHLYLVVSTGASRLQEMLADRWAVGAYGSTAFATGLRHVIAREVEFVADLNQTIDEVVKNKWSLPNLYAYDLDRRDPAGLEVAIRARMDRAPRQFDSHPTPHQRVDWAEMLALPGDDPHADDLEPVWALFPDPESIEREMTAIIRDRLQKKLGIAISDAEWEDDDLVP